MATLHGASLGVFSYNYGAKFQLHCPIQSGEQVPALKIFAFAAEERPIDPGQSKSVSENDRSGQMCTPT